MAVIVAQPFSSPVLLPFPCCQSLVDICFLVLLGGIYESFVSRSPGVQYVIKKKCNKKEKSCDNIRTKPCDTRASIPQDVENLNCSLCEQIKFPAGSGKLDPLNLRLQIKNHWMPADQLLKSSGCVVWRPCLGSFKPVLSSVVSGWVCVCEKGSGDIRGMNPGLQWCDVLECRRFCSSIISCSMGRWALQIWKWAIDIVCHLWICAEDEEDWICQDSFIVPAPA